jgi:hypothetical protein
MVMLAIYNSFGAVNEHKMRLWHFMRCCSASTIFLDAATELIVQLGAIKTVYFFPFSAVNE